MAALVFPDNTVLVNFASVDKLDLLEAVLDGNGRWCEAVADEARASARFVPAIESVEAAGWLGEPIEITETPDILQVESLRVHVFLGDPNRATQHLGEAQTCHIIKWWQDFGGSIWVSDDQDSLDYARRNFMAVKETKDIIREAIELGKIRADDAFALMEQMRALGQNPRMPKSAQDF